MAKINNSARNLTTWNRSKDTFFGTNWLMYLRLTLNLRCNIEQGFPSYRDLNDTTERMMKMMDQLPPIISHYKKTMLDCLAGPLITPYLLVENRDFANFV